METEQRQKLAERRGVKPGDVVRFTGSIWIDRDAVVVETHVDMMSSNVWILAKLDNGLTIATDGFEVVP